MLKMSNISRVLKPLNNISNYGTFKPVTHVIFDMDGLLLDTEGLYKTSIGALLGSFGKEYTTDLRLAVLGTREQDTSRIIVDSLQLPISHQEFAARAKEHQLKIMGNCGLMPGAERLIRHLHKNQVPIAVATSSSKESFERKTAKHKALFSLFHHVVMGSSDPECLNGKPAPDIFLLAAKRFPDYPEPTKCLVFEDAPNGVKAARAADMQVIMVPEDYIPDERKQDATLVLKTLLDFKPEAFGLPPFPEQ